MNNIYILDACALIAFLSKEIGYENILRIMELSENKKATVIMHSVNVLEVYYHIYRLRDEISAIKFLNELNGTSIQIHTEITNDVIRNAGKFKKKYKLSLADAIGLSEAIIHNGSFVTSDHHELDIIEKQENIKFTWFR
ncbi:hypothetical protein R80B4_01059 [Fibrobacteres bacterium R8-0-B4]